MASVISSLSGVSSVPPGLVEIVFTERREIGLSFDERVEELPGQPGVGHRFLTVTGIKAGGQAARDQRMHVGMVVHSIGDQEVHTLAGPEGEAAMILMQQRPVVFRFWAVPAVEEHHAAMSSAGSAVGSPRSEANSYMQPAAHQRWPQQQLAPVPEQSQAAPTQAQLPPMPTGQPQQPQEAQQDQPQPLMSASSHPGSAGPGAIAQIDHDIGAIHRAHSAVPPDQPGRDQQANLLIGQLQAALRKAERDLMQLKHDKDREVAAAVSRTASSGEQALPTSAYSMPHGQLVQELTAARLTARKQEDDLHALREALLAERENSRRLQEELDDVRKQNATLLMMNEELTTELEQGLDGDSAVEADHAAAAPALSPDDRNGDTTNPTGHHTEPTRPPTVAEQLARLAERDAMMPGPAATRLADSQSSAQPLASAPAAAPAALAPEPGPASWGSSTTGMGAVLTFDTATGSGREELHRHARALLGRVQARKTNASRIPGSE